MIKLTLKYTPNEVGNSITSKFGKLCKDEFSQNMLALMSDKKSSDIKFITKDKNEVVAHKLILRGNKIINYFFMQ